MSPWHAEFRYRHPNKGEIWIEGHSSPSREADGSIVWHGFIHDVKNASATVRGGPGQRPRLDTASQLAAGVAHDFNNLLTVISRESAIGGGRDRGRPARGYGCAGPSTQPKPASATTGGLRTGRRSSGGAPAGITHDLQTEGYYIVSGGGTMFTDGYIVDGRHNNQDPQERSRTGRPAAGWPMA